jgi:metal-responsive CopG/Arc/MetJ family transcriptional regulator
MMTRYDDIMRTIIDIPPTQLSALDSWSQARGISRAEAIRQAVARLLAAENDRKLAVDKTHGIWAGRHADGLTAQVELRSEWDER